MVGQGGNVPNLGSAVEPTTLYPMPSCKMIMLFHTIYDFLETHGVYRENTNQLGHAKSRRVISATTLPQLHQTLIGMRCHTLGQDKGTTA